MRSDRLVPDTIYSQLWKLASDTLPQFCCKLDLVLARLYEVYVNVESSPLLIRDWRSERLICFTLMRRSRIDIRFTIGCFLTMTWSGRL